MKRSIHCDRRPGRTQQGTGIPLLAYGIRVGYWPCLNGYFIELSWGAWRYGAWYGHGKGSDE